LEVSGQLQVPAALPPVSIGLDAGWAPDSVCTLWRREKALVRNKTRPPSPQPNAIPTELPRLPITIIIKVVIVVVSEELYLLVYNAVYSTEIQLTFRKKISPPSSGSKNRPSKKPK
jgi:hypothetical protein